MNPDFTPTVSLRVPARPAATRPVVRPAVAAHPTLTGPRPRWTRHDPAPTRRERRRARRAARPWWRRWYTWTAVTVAAFAVIGILAPPQVIKGPETMHTTAAPAATATVTPGAAEATQ